uniref:Hexosyltransferase n=1 Tax=Callorhinchus milii TaxID=7868 RepID=A0A4W3JI95_CALMI|eukprot:gi/632956042/ref/XP_007893764.1/ PREDICTED: beta-1,3-galactosyltransferase 5-like [Callorhinchus milii]
MIQRVKRHLVAILSTFRRRKKRSLLGVLALFLFCLLYRYERATHTQYKQDGFLLVPDSRCNVNPPFLVILVTSAMNKHKARAAIRQTWGKETTIGNNRIVTYFLLGYSTHYQQQLLDESLQHNDIIQQNFTDSYYNLTTKVLMGMEWVTRFCPSSSFVMKTDTDMFVNTYYLQELLATKNRSDFFTGDVRFNRRPKRSVNDKWYISKRDYPHPTYPPFCSGTGYVFSADIAKKVWEVSAQVPKFKLEDIYIALCLAKLKVVPVQMHSVKTFYASKVKFSVCRFWKLVTSHGMSPLEIQISWKAMMHSTREECPEERKN